MNTPNQQTPRALTLLLIVTALITVPASAVPPGNGNGNGNGPPFDIELIAGPGGALKAKKGELLVRLVEHLSMADLTHLARRNNCTIEYISPVAPVVVLKTKGKPVPIALKKLRRDELVVSATANVVVDGADHDGTPGPHETAPGNSGSERTTGSRSDSGARTRARTRTWSSQRPADEDHGHTPVRVSPDSEVVAAESGFDDPRAPLYRWQWNLHHAQASAGWAYGRGGGMTIAVLDSGISSAALSLEDRVDWEQARNFITPASAGEFNAEDDNGHGTHMASVIAGHQGMMGIAPNATVIPVKVLNAELSGTECALVEGLYYAATIPGLDVINLSLTFPPAYVPSSLLSEAIDYVASKGIVIVAASGNDGVEQVGYPAAFPDVLSVGAAAIVAAAITGDAPGTIVDRAPYSNFGFGVDVLGYGGDMTRDVDENGIPDGIIGQGIPTPENPGGWIVMEGTSPAAAQVSGAVALLLQAGVHPSRVRERFLQGPVGPGGDIDEGVLRLDRAFEMSPAEKTAAYNKKQARFFVNPTMALEALGESEDCSEGCRAVVLVEVTDQFGNAIPGAQVGVQIGGDVIEARPLTADANGLAHTVVDLPEGGAGLISVRVPWVRYHGALTTTPIMAGHVERMSYSLISNLGSGLATSSFVLSVDPTAWASTGYVDGEHAVPTYISRGWGVGHGFGAMVIGFTSDFYRDSGLADVTLLMHSWGSGLASSAIILDESWFRWDLRALWGASSLFVRHFTEGSGLASSALIADGTTLGWDAFFSGSEPAVVVMPTGPNQVATSVVWNADLLNPDLFQTTDAFESWSAAENGTGMASSAVMLDYDEDTVSMLGFDFNRLNDAIMPSGVGLVSSSMVMWTNSLATLKPTFLWSQPMQFFGRALGEPEPLVIP